MAKNSIGQFIAALRKANGMTQQDVAERLNVSNKAVSRWERDECAPDISVIPALAEMFDVTCDELLKGERIMNPASAENKGPKVEKQVKALVTRTLIGFKTLIWISLTVAIVGLIIMFGISYGIYRPVIGFATMLLFEACALAIAILAVSRTKDVKSYNELFEMAEEELISQFNHTLGIMSFWAFFVIFAVVLLSFPLILVTSDYVNSVVTPYSYFTIFLGGIVLILSVVYLKCKKNYMRWIVNGKNESQPYIPVNITRRKVTLIQLTLTIIAGVLFVVAPYFDFRPDRTTFLYTGTVLLGLACLLVSIACFMYFLIKQRTERKRLLLLGIRNTLLIPSTLIVSELHSVGWISNSPEENGWSVDALTRYDSWRIEYLWYAIAFAGIVLILFSLIELLIDKSHPEE